MLILLIIASHNKVTGILFIYKNNCKIKFESQYDLYC